MRMRYLYGIVLCFFFGNSILLSQESDEYYYLMLFSNILNHVKANYIEEMPAEELYKGAIEGIFQKLDPHTHYLSAEQLERFTQITDGSGYGVGIEFEIIENNPTVISVIEDSPADSKNIKSGDVLIEINDTSIPDNISSADLLLLLYGEANSKIKLKFRRRNEIIPVLLNRDKLDLNSLTNILILEPGIGYIKCSNFSATTLKEFKDAIIKLKKKDVEKLIIDLRNNPGGILESAVSVSDLFLPKGKKILYTTGRKDLLIQEYLAEDKEFNETPLVVLINNGTASASEILAGSLQDNKRATIIGTPSFGKGLIQSTFLLDNGGAILMTIGEYRTPSGRKIQREYKGRSVQDYYSGTRNDSTGSRSDSGGVYPDIIKMNNVVIDSIENNGKYEDLIVKTAISAMQNTPFEVNYKTYKEFKDSFKEILPLADSLNQTEDFKNILNVLIKAKIAGMIWGDDAELDYLREVDEQLKTAVEYLHNLKEPE